MGKKIERKCPVCGQMYLADMTRLGYGRETTCSRAFSYKLRAHKRITLVELVCPVCEKHFTRHPSNIEHAKWANVCSRQCLYRGRSLGIIKREIVKPYVYSPESKQAMIAASSKPKGKRVYHWMTCTRCGKQFDDPSYGRPRKSELAFCSLNCCNAYRVGENNPAWRGGHAPYYGPDWRPQRRKARKRDNYTCQECGKTQQENGAKLDVHHIVRFGDFDSYKEANRLSNLVTLCHPCHMKREWTIIGTRPLSAALPSNRRKAPCSSRPPSL